MRPLDALVPFLYQRKEVVRICSDMFCGTLEVAGR